MKDWEKPPRVKSFQAIVPVPTAIMTVQHADDTCKDYLFESGTDAMETARKFYKKARKVTIFVCGELFFSFDSNIYKYKGAK